MIRMRRRITSRLNQSSSNNHEDNAIEEIYDFESVYLSPKIGLGVFVFWSALVLYIGLYFNDRLPQVDLDSFNKLQFNTDNVLQDLKVLTSFGPKVTGSQANEFDAIRFLTKRILEIINQSLPIHNITYDLQKTSGKFPLKIFSNSHVITYKNIQNIIVKIGPKVNSENSLLINCHFDSVPISPGASDDGLNCAVMLEMFRILSISKMKLPHNIIFLFNGAEENPLIGSHGFITKHKWAPEVNAFINLESCGAGGKEVLFQAGPNHPWLIETYGKAAKYPSGIVTAEEIFQSGLIPSDTDFRIFRDFGQIPGLDFAHCKNGYVYHTKYDSVESIESPHGVIRHTGENILSLSKALLFSKEFSNPQLYENGKQVYFDLFGLIFINYSADVGTYLNIVVSFMSVLGIYLTISKLHSGNMFEIVVKLLMALASLLTFFIIASCYNLFIALTLDLLGYSMSWYKNPGLVILIYVIPPVFTMVTNTILVDSRIMENVALDAKIRLSSLSIQLLWTVFLVGSIFLHIRSSFLLLIIVFPCALWTLTASLLQKGNYKIWHLVFIINSTFSSSMICYLGITSLRLFIPITGRMGVKKNPEFLISLLTTLLSIAVFSYASTFFMHVKKRWTVLKVLFGLHLLSFFIIISPIGFPFSVKTPQRVLATHVNRQYFDSKESLVYSDSLFWIQNMERRGRSVLPFLRDSQLLDEFCKESGYCGLPWFSKLKESTGSSCIPVAPHELGDDLELKIVSKHLNQNEFNLEISISGPDHIGVIITPSNVKLLDWNLPSSIEQSSNTIAFVQGLNNSSQTIILEAMKVSPDSFIKVEFYGLYFHHDKYYSLHFVNFLNKFPSWSHVTPAMAVYKSYIFK